MDLTLTAEQERLRDLARAFATDEVRPISRRYDKERDPAATHPRELFLRADELGLRTMSIPRELGGLDADLLTEIVVLEELCTGDAGFGMSLQHSWREGRCLATLTSETQRERFLGGFLSNPLFLTARAMSEPEVGSDSSVGYDADIQAGPRTTARLEGGTWVLNGTKRWITNGNVADLYMIVARTDPTVPWTRGISVFLVPKGTPGLVPGKAEDKVGIRTNQNGEVVLEDLRVPEDHLLGERDGGREMMRAMGGGSKAKTAAKSLGIARAAFEELLTLATGGAYPVEQSVDDALAVLAIDIEATRSLMWRAGWALQEQRPEGAMLERMAFVRSSEVCARASSLVLDLLGQQGLVGGTLAEKLVRDAATMLHAGGGKQAVRARIGQDLRAQAEATASGTV